MEFKKYNSIENTYRKLTIEQIQKHAFNRGEWHCLNKCHGANFSIYCDPAGRRYAKKTAFITDGESFFRHEVVVDKLNDNITELYNSLKESLEISEMILYGELAGGMYNHPDVSNSNHAKKVQKGISYSPDNFFYLFDIKIDGKWLDHSIVVSLGNIFGFITAAPLFTGTFEECMEQSCVFQDPIHQLFSLPTIDDNVSEGLVIKPDKTKFFGNGKRVLLKNKNPKFSEKGKKKEFKGKPFKYTPLGAELCTKFSVFITENRLRNVLSHGELTEITDKDFGKIMKLFNVDVYEAFMKDYKEEYVTLDKKEQKMISRKVSCWSSDLIRANFLNIIDQKF